MKSIEFTNTTLEMLMKFLGRDVEVLFDGFGYMFQTNSDRCIFYNTDELAESINGKDEAIVLTSRIEEEIDCSIYKTIKNGKIYKIYTAQTVLTFSKETNVNIFQKIGHFVKGLKSKTSWKLFRILFSKLKTGYSSYCINPMKYNLEKRYPCNYVKCGFLIEFNDGSCLPLFSNQNSIFMMNFENKKSQEFINEWKESYDFQLTIASTG